MLLDCNHAILCVLPFDVENVKPDFACASIHKHLFAPYGMCLLYVDQKWCDIGVPLEFHEHKRLGASGDVCLPFNNIINEEKNQPHVNFETVGNPELPQDLIKVVELPLLTQLALIFRIHNGRPSNFYLFSFSLSPEKINLQI